jgi:hypothetical protein
LRHLIRRDLDRAPAPFDPWVRLDRTLHRLEGRESEVGEDMTVESRRMGIRPAAVHSDTPQEHEPTAELFREAVDETRELVRLEVELAKEELRAEVKTAKMAGIALGAGAGAALSGVTMFFVAIAMAFHMEWLASLIIGGILLALAAVLGLGGYKALPKRPLEETKERFEADLKQLKERVA